ncbi:hypothetical protein C1922_07790 [Stenotrophomonas sp. ZAC14D2_NAIMI4_7]|uniref:hypothetical protein n=1 Tax=Stenotrophomonas sp. ZAC14D2_NAIMI4_7 TaxID=2072405 RepID=UPI000D53D9A9|nr:hypothetical protein [Stenotrophomonas sp. ZAC14D2_NAIMI4_7]AWH17221.1 hypothetical protein C1922_07790 [Stenotrophomonas sp. ZAC14D2_NAIMI4_7]
MKLLLPLALAGLATLVLPAAAAEIRVVQPVPFSESAIIAEAIKAECTIGTTLAQSLAENAIRHGNTLVSGPVGADSGNGRSLKLELVEAQSAGNAFTGHFKSAAVRGVLFEDGRQIATVTARRVSRGGAFAGFKGSCTVLDRTVNAIGEDLAGWLAAPVDNARLGNL